MNHFLNLTNRLSDELSRAADDGYRSALVSELNAYARFHFRSEENMTMRAAYPQLEQHKAHHRALIDKLSYEGSLISSDNASNAADAVLDFLTDWFLHHTNEEDRLFAEFLHAQEQAD